MIRRLRLKFICVNMLIVTVMMGVIFGLVYHFTQTGLETQSVSMLQSIAAEPFRPNRPGKPPEGVQLPFFMLELDEDGSLTAAGGGYYDLTDEEFLNTLVSAADESDAPIGVLPEYGLRYCRSVTPFGERIVFADMSSEQAMLSHLLQTCAVIAVLCFAAFLLISWLLARWAVQPVEKAWQQQRQFVADASHELKTPLTVILTNAELLQAPGYDAPARSRFAGSILTMSQQMRGLVESLLELARVDAGRAQDAQTELDLSALVNDALLPFEPVLFEAGHTLTARVEDGIRVRGNAAQLRQVVEILLDNARKYAQPGGWVLLTLARQGGRHCVLSVADPGAPLTPQECRDIFKRFYRVDHVRAMNHSYGLGLAIAARIAEAHRGRIWAESSGGINTFYFTMPI